jgi:cobalt-zinc-cadmium efflux system outer membrane protein
MMKMPQRILLPLCFAFLVLSSAHGQERRAVDTLRADLPTLEKRFLDRNLFLLAQQYQINAAKAMEIQAGLYPNPSFSAEISLYNDSKGWFDLGRSGQQAFNLDQVILLAGKRNKRIALAREDSRQAEWKFRDLLRTLRYELHADYHVIRYNRELIAKIDEQLNFLDRIIHAYEEQAAKRNVSMKDVVRLQTEYIQLRGEKNEFFSEVLEAEKNLQIITDTSVWIVATDTLHVPVNMDSIPALAECLERAFANRGDLRMQESMLKQSELNVGYQKALAVPDLHAGFGYDQNGSYVPRYYNAHVAIDLPVFNRNQGSIRAAQEGTLSERTVLTSLQHGINAEVQTALGKLYQYDREYDQMHRKLSDDFKTVNQGMLENFNKGNISILEFLDFFESYNAAIRELNQLQRRRAESFEELQFAMGVPIKP